MENYLEDHKVRASKISPPLFYDKFFAEIGPVRRILRNYVSMRVVEDAGSTDAEEAGGMRTAVIRIGDNGPGMDEALKQRAFEPFMTGDSARSSGTGTGRIFLCR